MPIAQIQAPDGSVFEVEYPQGASDDEILNFVTQNADSFVSQTQPQPQQAQQPSDVDIPKPFTPQELQEAIERQKPTKTGSFLRGTGQGATLGTADEIRAGLRALTDLGPRKFSDVYSQELEESQRVLDKDLQTNPLFYLGGQLVGGLAIGGGAGATRAGAAATKAIASGSKIATTTKAAGAGSLIGAFEGGASARQGERLKGAAIGGAVGGLTGGLLEGVGAFLRGGKKLPPEKPSIIPNADELRKIASNVFKEAESAGGVLKSEVTDSFLNSVNALKKQSVGGKIVEGETEFTKLVRRIDQLKGRKLTFDDVKEIDEALGDAVDSYVDVRGRLIKTGKKILDIQTELRNAVENATPNQVIGGKESFDKVKEARKLLSQSVKLSDIERIIIRSENAVQPATVLKNGFRTLLANPKKLRGFTDDEKDLIRNAAQTGRIEGLIQSLGSRLNVIIPFSSGTLTGTAAGAVVSTLARETGTALQAKRATQLTDLIASGGEASPVRISELTPKTLGTQIGGTTQAVSGAGEALGTPTQQTESPQNTPALEDNSFDQELNNIFGSDKAPQKEFDFDTQLQNIFEQKPKPQASGNFAQQLIQAESSGNPNAKASTSTASGLFGLTDGTFKSLVNKYGKTDGVDLSDRGDPYAERKMFERLTNEHENSFKASFGRKPNNTELYALHFLGDRNGKRFVKLSNSRPNIKGADIFKSAASANKTIFYKKTGQKRTIAEIYKILQNKVS